MGYQTREPNVFGEIFPKILEFEMNCREWNKFSGVVTRGVAVTATRIIVGISSSNLARLEADNT